MPVKSLHIIVIIVMISSFYWTYWFIKTKVHYASWSNTCSLACAGEQVSDTFVGICDKLATFQVKKPVADRIALSRHVLIELAGLWQVRCVSDVLARWTLKTTRRTNLFDTSLMQYLLILCY